MNHETRSGYSDLKLRKCTHIGQATKKAVLEYIECVLRIEGAWWTKKKCHKAFRHLKSKSKSIAALRIHRTERIR